MKRSKGHASARASRQESDPAEPSDLPSFRRPRTFTEWSDAARRSLSPRSATFLL
jgi:hypothetical protein